MNPEPTIVALAFALSVTAAIRSAWSP